MRRMLAALVAALVSSAAASAQSSGADGSGVQRGIQSLNNSGQVGTVTLFAKNGETLIVVELHGTLGSAQSVRVLRGPSCESLGPPPAFILADLHRGRSSSAVGVDVGKLLSGNYNVVILSSTTPGAATAACGHLYAS